MEILTKTGRWFYCIGLVGMVAPQFFYAKFGVNFFPAWPGFPFVAFWACLFTIVTIAACIAIFLEIKPVLMGAVLSALSLDFLFIKPYYTFHIDSAEDALLLLLFL